MAGRVGWLARSGGGQGLVAGKVGWRAGSGGGPVQVVGRGVSKCMYSSLIIDVTISLVYDFLHAFKQRFQILHPKFFVMSLHKIKREFHGYPGIVGSVGQPKMYVLACEPFSFVPHDRFPFNLAHTCHSHVPTLARRACAPQRRFFTKRFYYSVEVHGNLNVVVNHSIKLVFRVQALRWHVALIDMPISIRLREFQTASSGQHVEMV